MANETSNVETTSNSSAMFIDEPSASTVPVGIGRRRFANRQFEFTTTTPPPSVNNDNGVGFTTTIEQEDKTPKDTYFHRRTMAYISLFVLIILSFALFFIIDPARINAISGALTILAPVFGTVILAYIGASTISFIKGIGK